MKMNQPENIGDELFLSTKTSYTHRLSGMDPESSIDQNDEENFHSLGKCRTKHKGKSIYNFFHLFSNCMNYSKQTKAQSSRAYRRVFYSPILVQKWDHDGKSHQESI